MKGKRGLTILDRDLPAFGIKVARDGKKTFFVLKSGGERLILGTADAMTAAQAREKALATLDEAKTGIERGTLSADFAADFMRRYRLKPRERFLSAEELKRMGFVLDHADDEQAAAAIRLLLFTGARSSEIAGLIWRWIRGSRAVLPDSKTGLKTIQLPPTARARR